LIEKFLFYNIYKIISQECVKLELKNVESFLMIAECGSFSEAAEALNITQPTISFRIKQLESEFDTILFKRINGKKITLTEIGEEVYPDFKNAYELIKKAEKVLQKGRNIEKNITISSPNHMGVNIMPELLQVLYKSFPHMEFKVQIEDTKDTIQLIKQGDVKFGLGYVYSEKELDHRNLILKKITNEENIIDCSPTHPLARKEKVNSEDLMDERIIIYNRNNFFASQNIGTYLREQGILNTKYTEINNLGWIKMMVRKGVGISILQKMIVEDELKSGQLVKISMPIPLPQTPVYLIFNSDTPKDLMEIVITTIKKILVKNM